MGWPGRLRRTVCRSFGGAVSSGVHHCQHACSGYPSSGAEATTHRLWRRAGHHHHDRATRTGRRWGWKPAERGDHWARWQRTGVQSDEESRTASSVACDEMVTTSLRRRICECMKMGEGVEANFAGRDEVVTNCLNSTNEGQGIKSGRVASGTMGWGRVKWFSQTRFPLSGRT